jgi:tetratricopeptide (TPR) repeat protein
MDPKRRQFGTFVKQTAQVSVVGALALQFIGNTDVLERFVQAVTRPSLIDTTLLGELRSSVTDCYTLLPSIAGIVSSEHLTTVHTRFAYLVEVLEAQLYPSVRTPLTSLAAECSLLLGTMYHNMQLPAVAERYYTTACTAAEEADNLALKAVIRGRMSILPIEHAHSLALLQEAVPLAQKHGTATTYSWLLARKAEHLSVDPQYATECEQTLALATTFSPKGDPEHDPYWTCFDEGQMYGYQGSCYVSLRKLETAKTAHLQALQLTDPDHIYRQTQIQLDLAEVYQLQDDIVNACLCGHRALSLISRTHSPWHWQGLAGFRAKFPPGETDASLQAFDEHKMSAAELLQKSTF